jgi:hypothetical protein
MAFAVIHGVTRQGVNPPRCAPLKRVSHLAYMDFVHFWSLIFAGVPR